MDFKKLDKLDRVVVITALVTLISMFLPWYGWSQGSGGSSWSGFSSGFWGWLGVILIIGAGVYLLRLRSGSKVPKTSFGPGVTVLGASALGTLCVIIRWVSIPKASLGFASYGPKVGLYLALVAGIIQVFISFKLFKATGEKLPWDEKKTAA